MSSFATELPEATAYLSRKSGAAEFSAMTACFGHKRVIIYNDNLPPTRSHADIMHEISHLMLLHPPQQLRADTGGRHCDCELEDEANWLGPALVVSEGAATAIAQQGMNAHQTAKIYHMRLNITGAKDALPAQPDSLFARREDIPSSELRAS